jgi:hypothetical protein
MQGVFDPSLEQRGGRGPFRPRREFYPRFLSTVPPIPQLA